MRTDPFLEERCFLRVVETGSLTAAAKLLQTDVSTASRRLAALEARLGVKLVERTTRRAEPTEAGLRYFEGLRRLIDDHDQLESDVRQQTLTPQGLLRISAPSNLGERHVAVWALDFQRRYPEVLIELVLEDRYVDLRSSGIDLAIRIGKLPDSTLTTKHLGVMDLALVAAPQYLEERGTPETPEDLSGHSFVLYGLLQTGNRMTLGQTSGAEIEIVMASRFCVSSIGGVAEAVLAGGGIHAGALWLFARYLASGELIHVLPDWRPPSYAVHAIHPYERRAPAKVARFIEFIGPKLKALDGVRP